MPDPVAWTMIEHGWKVFDAEGEEVGTVHEVAGDENADIFDGLDIHGGILSGDRYVPSESVGSIYEGEVHLTLNRAQVEALGRYTKPAAEEQVIPESSTWYQRLAWWLTGRNR